MGSQETLIDKQINTILQNYEDGNIILVSGSGDKCAPPFIKNWAHFYSGGVAKPEYIEE